MSHGASRVSSLMSELRASSQARAWELLTDTPCVTSAYEPTLLFIIHGSQTAVLCLEAENLTISITETPFTLPGLV